MTFQAKDVMKRASTILQDEDAVRWTAPELHAYLNDGLREIVSIKPNALSKTVNLQLQTGTLQSLPTEYTVFSRVTRNMTTPTTGGKAIRALAKREIMDSHMPSWQDPAVMPFAKSVVHVIHDLADPRSYYVVPGNDGTGLIEAVVGAMPQPNAAPAGVTDQLEVDNYTNVVDMPDIYQNALIDYVLYRAYSKDSRMAGAAQRSEAHFTLFRTAVTNFSQAEAGMALATQNMTPASAG
jgi:hypothetical protein